MKIKIVSHEFARNLVMMRPETVVIINDPNDDYQTIRDIKAYANKYLYLEFFDIKIHLDTHRGPERKDIEVAINWYKDREEDIIVTCTAGISRSAALAFVLACSNRSAEEAALVWNPRLHYPNSLIVELGADVLGKPEMVEIAKDFWGERARRRHLKGKPPRIND